MVNSVAEHPIYNLIKKCLFFCHPFQDYIFLYINITIQQISYKITKLGFPFSFNQDKYISQFQADKIESTRSDKLQKFQFLLGDICLSNQGIKDIPDHHKVGMALSLTK